MKPEEKARQELPGAAINAADEDKTTKKLVKEEVCTLNNNPRNNDSKMP